MTTARNSARLRAFRAPALLAIAMLASLAVSPAASAGPIVSAPPTECTGTIGAETVDRIVVPDGATCTLNGTTVVGNVVVGAGSSLITTGATLGGNVRADDGPDIIRLIDTNIERNIFVKRATGEITIGAAGCAVDPVAGNNVKLTRNKAPIAICLMSIGENLQLSNNKRRIGVFDNVVGNNLQATDNTGASLRLRDNMVGISGGGSIQVDDNHVGVLLLERNDAGNHIDCDGNTPDPAGSGNTADNGLTGQCATLG